jgi:hypothetical protein
MKSFQQFLTESITINGDFNGTLNVGGSSPEQASESYFADVVWEGKIYRMEIEGSMPSKNALGRKSSRRISWSCCSSTFIQQHLKSINIKSTQRYRPERLNWSD